jgi:hypothetical protein
MANHVKRLSVPASDRVELERRVRTQTGQARDGRRSRIVLLAAEGRESRAVQGGGLSG